jgi:hypothetical protein
MFGLRNGHKRLTCLAIAPQSTTTPSNGEWDRMKNETTS